MARLTAPDQDTFAEFTVVTSTTAFPITFSLFAKADLSVLIDGVALSQAAFTFTGTLLDGGGYDGGTVTLNTAVDDVTVRIERNVSPERTSNFAPAASTPVGAVDQAFNRLTMVQQDQGRAKAERPYGRAGKYLAFDADGNEIAASGTGADAALRTDLAATGGGTLVGTRAALPGATNRTQASKNADVVNVLDFGPVSTSTTNLATQADAADNSALWYGIAVPSGVHVIGAANSTICLRKGQSLDGAGLGASTMDASTRNANTQPLITFGMDSLGAEDAGGQGVSLSNMTLKGGPDSFAFIKSTVAGYRIDRTFFTGPGIGIEAGGSDGQIQGCIFDLGLTHIWTNGFNLQVGGCLFYDGSYQITVRQGSSDLIISTCLFEYFRVNAILFDTGATNIRNVRIANCSFLQNEQFPASEAAISDRATAAEFAVSNSEFRNLFGAGILLVDAGSVCGSSNNTFDGTKTKTAYAQSATMRGIHVFNGTRLESKGDTFRNLPGIPIEIGGTAAITVFILNATFSGNTGGAADIVVSNTNAASRVYVIGCRSSRTLVSVTGSAVVENVPLTQDTGWTAGTGTANKRGYGVYATGTASAAYSQAEMQGVRDNLDAVSRRVLAVERASRGAGLIDG